MRLTDWLLEHGATETETNGMKTMVDERVPVGTLFVMDSDQQICPLCLSTYPAEFFHECDLTPIADERGNILRAEGDSFVATFRWIPRDPARVTPL